MKGAILKPKGVAEILVPVLMGVGHFDGILTMQWIIRLPKIERELRTCYTISGSRMLAVGTPQFERMHIWLPRLKSVLFFFG